MYTTCTECKRQFRIRADQLNIAEGQVICGYCGNQFNALDSLSDSPGSPPEANQEANVKLQDNESVYEKPIGSTTDERSNDETAIEKNSVDIDEITTKKALINDDLQQGEVVPSNEWSTVTEKDKVMDASTASELFKVAIKESETDLAESDQAVENLDEFIKDLTVLKNDDDDFEVALSKPAALSTELSIDDEDQDDALIAELFEDNEEPQQSIVSRLFWSFFALLLLVGLLIQVGWFRRDEIMLRYPESTHYYQQLCSKLDCDVIQNQDFSKITILNRDVRTHPSYENSLLVNAVMENQGQKKLPYPNIQLSLFNTSGEMVSYRKFEPGQYLETDTDLIAGMAPNSPVHFVLELSGYNDNAVSFEFDFY